MVNASPLDALPELRHALLVGGTTALHAFSHAVESGTVRVRTGKVSPGRNSEPRTTPSTPRTPVRALSNDEISDVLERSARGEQPVEIAQVHGRHPVTVRAIIAGRIVAKQVSHYSTSALDNARASSDVDVIHVSHPRLFLPYAYAMMRSMFLAGAGEHSHLCHATQSHTHSLARPALSRIYTNL